MPEHKKGKIDRKMRNGIMRAGRNSYSIQLSIGRDPVTGKRIQQWISFKGTLKEAQQKRNELVHQINTGSFMRPGKTTLAEYLKKWLSDYVKPNISPRGFERYQGIIVKHLIPDLGSIPLAQLKSEHLQRHYSIKLNNGLSAGTVRYHHAVIHKALQTAIKLGLVSHNVADGVDIPRIQRKEMQTWDEYDLTRFLEAAKASPYYVLFHTALFTGMRRSELLALRWSDVDFVFSQISVSRGLHHLKDGSYIFTQPKSRKSRRTIALSPSPILTLKEHKGKQEEIRAKLGLPFTCDDLIFTDLQGKPFRPNTITRAWTMLAQNTGVRVIRLHDARHTHASIMLKQGIHPKVVQERLGHSSIQMTLDTYSHVAPGIQAAAANRFDEALTVSTPREISPSTKF